MTHAMLSVAEIHDLAFACLKANGCDDENARAVADTVTAAERDGCHSHGLFRLPGYVASLRSGKVKGDADPVVERLAPGVLRVDGDDGYAPLALERGRDPLIAAARENGIAALSLVRTHHFAALWVEIEPLAAAGLAAFAFTAFKPGVAPAGGAKALFGTNPMAFGWPRRDGRPMVFDQASAVMAKGEVMIAAREGHSLPPGVGLDRSGQPTTDPQAIVDGGVLLPFGGYKGSAIAMMIELLVGALIGERMSFEAAQHDNNDGGPPRGGELLLALDPARFGDPDGWLEHGEKLFDEMLAIEGVRLPGGRRYRNRQRNEGGQIAVPEALRQKIMELTG